MPLWRVAWTQPEEFANTFNLYLRERDGAWTPLGSTNGTTMDIEVPQTTARFEVGIAPVVNGIEAYEDLWAIEEFTPGSLEDIAPPPDVSTFTVEQLDQSFDVRARWSPVVDEHLDGYEIREGSSWETGWVRAFVPAPGDDRMDVETQFGILSPKSTTYMIRAYSKQGQYSDSEASVTVALQVPNTYKAETPTDEHGGGFTGTKTDVEVSSGDLQVTAAPATASAWTDLANTYDWPPGRPHHGEGVYVTGAVEAQDDAGTGIVVDEVVQIDIEGSKTNLVTWTADMWLDIVQPEFAADNATATDPNDQGLYSKITADEEVIDGLGLAIEIRTTEDDPASSPTWSSWRTFVPGARYRYRGVQLRFTLTSVWTWVWKVTKMTITRYRRNLKDEVRVTDGTGSGGYPVSFTEPFTQKPVVSVTVEGTSARYATVDSVTRTGCNIYLWTDGDPATQTTGTAHVVAAGV